MNQALHPLTVSVVNDAAAVLKIDALDLLFRQSDIRALESASEVDGSTPAQNSVGWIAYLRQRWPVYCLSGKLDLLREVPSARRTCALLVLEGGYIGLLCDDMNIVKQVAGQRHAVPPAMRHADTPIVELLTGDGRLLCVSNPNRMAAYIEQRVRNAALAEELPCPT